MGHYSFTNWLECYGNNPANFRYECYEKYDTMSGVPQLQMKLTCTHTRRSCNIDLTKI